MSKFVIKGGKKLEGEIRISGMKNAATPILAACLLTKEECIIENVPQILDVERLLKLIESLGARVKRKDDKVSIKADNLKLDRLDQTLVQSMRSSILIWGPLLVRLGEVKMPLPGGCIIGARPIDTHLYVFRTLGAQINVDDAYYYLKAVSGLKPAILVLPEFSVTATENAIMAASLLEGETIIKLAASEPHVQDLCNFLNKMGAKISGIGTHTLRIEGAKKLKGVSYKIIPDQIEIGTFAVAGALSKGKLRLSPVIFDHLDIVLLKLREIGVKFNIGSDWLDIEYSPHLKAFQIKALPYPGFPTDLQAPWSVLATQASGTSLIHDPLYEGRLNYVQELIKMGANAIICDPHRVLISGPTPLYGQEIKSYDLRAGATLILAALIAEGETVIYDAQTVDRGYEKIEERLTNIGADIKRIP